MNRTTGVINTGVKLGRQGFSRNNAHLGMAIALMAVFCSVSSVKAQPSPPASDPNIGPAITLSDPLIPSFEQLETSRLNNPVNPTPVAAACPPPQAPITANSICPSGLTVPSLWWATEQFSNKLIDNWLAYPGDVDNTRRVDLVLNQTVWSLMDYIERYEFINHMGTVARDYGYNLRLFTRRGALLGAYTCNFGATGNTYPSDPTATGATQAATCDIFLDFLGRGGIRGGS